MQRPPARLLASVAVLAALAAGGCSTTTGSSSPDTTGSIATDTAPRSTVQWRQEMDSWGERYRANPADPDAAIRYAQALRAVGQRAQAAAVLEQAAIHNPDNRVVLGAYGRALADNGSYQQALDVLNRAHTPDQPDWRILSVQGAVLDQMGRHADAQRHYASALRLMPDEPSVLSNLGLSYALSKNLHAGRGDAAARRGAAAAPSRRCGRISRSSSACRAASRRPRPSPAAIFRPTRPPPTSPICGRCWRSRATGKRTSAARRWRRRPAS